jgi:hypothetical protein
LGYLAQQIAPAASSEVAGALSCRGGRLAGS